MGRVLLWTATSALLSALVAYYVYGCPDLAAVRGTSVVICGASSGIGAELAKQYGALGARVVIAARRRSQLEEVAEVARAAGAQGMLAVPTDMGDKASVEALIAAAVAANGGIDTLVLNHAAFDEGMWLESFNSSAAAEEALIKQFRVNVLGSSHAARAALPYLEASGGHIAVVSSASTKVAAPFHPGYVTTKRALTGLFDAIRSELDLLGSRVSIGVLTLGMIATEEVTRDEGLRSFAMPVPACAAEMICAIQRRLRETFVPKHIALFNLASALHPGIGEFAMRSVYIDKVPRYVQRIAELRPILEHWARAPPGPQPSAPTEEQAAAAAGAA